MDWLKKVNPANVTPSHDDPDVVGKFVSAEDETLFHWLKLPVRG